MRYIVSMIVDFYECCACCRRAFLIVFNFEWYCVICLTVHVFYLHHLADKLNGFYFLFLLSFVLQSIVSVEIDSSVIAGDHSHNKNTTHQTMLTKSINQILHLCIEEMLHPMKKSRLWYIYSRGRFNSLNREEQFSLSLFLVFFWPSFVPLQADCNNPNGTSSVITPRSLVSPSFKPPSLSPINSQFVRQSRSFRYQSTSHTPYAYIDYYITMYVSHCTCRISGGSFEKNVLETELAAVAICEQ